jgi:aryl-alcohol dehydrogenase-like predicted oxidoreductase
MAKIPTRQLGKNGPQVSALGFGAMGLSAFYGTPASDEERFKVLDRAIELGSTYFDSADMYGDNEDLLGKYFKKYPEQRKKVSLAIEKIILTKIFFLGISCNKICGRCVS